eukprot:Mrub_11274.p1 GENE.Mrub_11274~~Mrub_11274.p1  ORF type:complete len:168 (-),score=5.33 Mrub_11274:98-601(-)
MYNGGNPHNVIPMKPQTLTDKIRSPYDFQMFLIEQDYYFADYDGQFTAYFLEGFKNGTKKLFKLTEINPFFCPLSKYVKDTTVQFLKKLVVKFTDIKQYFNERALDKCPREYYLAVFAKIRREYMLDVRARCIQYHYKPKKSDKKRKTKCMKEWSTRYTIQTYDQPR